MSKLHDLTEEQKALEAELYFMDRQEEEDSERAAELDALLAKNRGGRINTLIFLYGIRRETKLKLAARKAQTELIRKDDLLPAMYSEKIAQDNLNRIESVMLRILDDPSMVDINLPDGKTINKKLNPGKLVINEAALNLAALPDSLTRTIPEHKELLPPVPSNEKTGEPGYPGAAALIKQELMDSVKDSKGRMNKVDSFITLDELPGFALVRDAVIQVK